MHCWQLTDTWTYINIHSAGSWLIPGHISTYTVQAADWYLDIYQHSAHMNDRKLWIYCKTSDTSQICNKSWVSQYKPGVHLLLTFDTVSDITVSAISDIYVIIMVCVTASWIGLYQISAPANLEYSHFSEIQASLDPPKCLARFGRCQCSCSICLLNYG